MKRCSRCKIEKPFADFHKTVRSKDGLASCCRACSKLYCREWRAKNPIIFVYMGMMSRCYCPTSDSFKNYGARGIQVCDGWRHNFQAFRNWALAAGYAPGLQLDRIDNDADYSPANCRFITQLENLRSRGPRVKLAAFIQRLLHGTSTKKTKRELTQPIRGESHVETQA